MVNHIVKYLYSFFQFSVENSKQQKILFKQHDQTGEVYFIK